MHLYVHILQITHKLSGTESCAEATHVWVSSIAHTLRLHTGIVFYTWVHVGIHTVASG